MAYITLYKRKSPNIQVLVDDDIYNQLLRWCWIDHKEKGAMTYRSRKKNSMILSRYVWYLKYGFWPVKLYHIDKNKYDCRIENLTKKCIYPPTNPNLQALKCDFVGDRMIGTFFNKKKHCYCAQRGYKGGRLTVCFSTRQLDYFKAKDLAEQARLKLVQLNPVELENFVKFKRHKPKVIATGRNKVYNFSDIGYNKFGEFDVENIDNFLYNNSKE